MRVPACEGVCALQNIVCSRDPCAHIHCTLPTSISAGIRAATAMTGQRCVLGSTDAFAEHPLDYTFLNECIRSAEQTFGRAGNFRSILGDYLVAIR